MYQITDARFAEAKRYCIRDHAAVERARELGLDVVILDHPLIRHKLTVLRNKDTASPTFRQCGAIALLSGDVATALRLMRVARVGGAAGPVGPVGHGTIATVDAVPVLSRRHAVTVASVRDPDLDRAVVPGPLAVPAVEEALPPHRGEGRPDPVVGAVHASM